jgi:hypothetical protein
MTQCVRRFDLLQFKPIRESKRLLFSKRRERDLGRADLRFALGAAGS